MSFGHLATPFFEKLASKASFKSVDYGGGKQVLTTGKDHFWSCQKQLFTTGKDNLWSCQKQQLTTGKDHLGPKFEIKKEVF